MKRILFFLFLATNVHAATEAVAVDSQTRDVKNTGVINFATDQLTVNDVPVAGGAGGLIDNLTDIPTRNFSDLQNIPSTVTNPNKDIRRENLLFWDDFDRADTAAGIITDAPSKDFNGINHQWIKHLAFSPETQIGFSIVNRKLVFALGAEQAAHPCVNMGTRPTSFGARVRWTTGPGNMTQDALVFVLAPSTSSINQGFHFGFNRGFATLELWDSGVINIGYPAVPHVDHNGTFLPIAIGQDVSISVTLIGSTAIVNYAGMEIVVTEPRIATWGGPVLVVEDYNDDPSISKDKLEVLSVWAGNNPVADAPAITTNTLSQFAATTSAQLAGVLTDETGSGSFVTQTNPILLFPNAAQAANAIDVTKQSGTKTISADTTFTLSAAPANGSSFGLKLTNSDTAAHTITLPSGTWKSDSRQGATITTFSLPGSSTVTLSVDTEPSSTYRLFGEPLTAADLTTEPTPAGTDFVVIHDVSSGKDKKALISDLPGSGGTSYVFNVETYGAVHNGVTNDRTAINAAIAACYTAGGGTVFFPNGHYIISGSTWDATTNSLLTVPTTTGYGDVQIVELVGQTRGTINGSTRAYISGVVLDASAATGASGVFPAVFAAAEFQEITDVTLDPDQWVSLGVRMRHLTIVVPGDSDFGGIQLHNCMQGRVEDCYVIGMTTSGFVAADNPEAVGIIYPAHLNNLHVKGSENSVLGFFDGIWAGEHQKFDGDNVAFCKNGVRFRHNAHMAKGDLMIERCERVLVVDAAATKLRFDLLLEAEVGDLGGDPYTPAGTFSGYYDVNGIGKGILRSSCLYLGVGYGELSHSDVAGVRFEDINNIDQFGVTAAAPTDYIARYNFEGDLTDETATYNLTGVGSPTFSGGAVILNGTTQYATNATLNLSATNFTIFVEVKYATTQNSYIACQMHTTAANNRWQQFTQTDDSVQVGVIATGGSPETTTGPLAPATRHNIVFDWNNTTGVQRVKANGAAWVVEASSGTMNTTGTAAAFSVGARQDGVAKLNGEIYEIRIFNRSGMSAAEVAKTQAEMAE